MSSDVPRTVVLGFDALDFEYLDEFDAELPNFSRLRSDGIDAPLRSTHPPWTGSAWPSMYTGSDPTQHNAFGFFDYTNSYPDEASIITRNDVAAPALWNYLTAIDEPSIVLNVPVTHPAEPLTGALVPGYLAPEDADGYPETIRDELSDALGEEYSIYSKGEMSSNKSEKLDGYVHAIGLRARAAKYLLENWDWRVAVVQVQKTDAVFHNFDDPTAFRRVYRTADELVGTVLKTAPDANVVVCSDHGMGITDGYKIFVNEILREHGFVEAAANGDDHGTGLATVKDSLVEPEARDDSESDRTLTRTALTKGVTGLSAVGITPGKVYTTAQRFGLGSALKRAVPQNVIAVADQTVDWRGSKAYCRALGELGVRINLEGRDPEGVVPESEYENVRSELIEILSEVRTPDGKPAFEFVKRAEAVSSGSDPKSGPDVVFMPTEMNHLVLPSLVGERFLPVEEYNHKPDGVFIGAGPSFDETATLAELSLSDVAPIAMAAAGLPVPEQMTGAVPDGLLAGAIETKAYTDVEFGTDGNVGTEGQVESRLEDLGYL
ncbi:alkaline phosphatase family protein [Haladaptatus caseinilyticus]|uniref:alkaline phosphatase family protein n=1 Tax=Haladaptatus caseinilyticus TaxID=2993314 RepID=UPI00224B738A|nr:alkaline phosphatase family protein [Haladaptatus caseinilyticus]